MRGKLRSLLVVGIAIASSAALTGTARAAEPYGVWLRPSSGSQARFYNCGGKLCATIVAVKDESRKGEIGKSILHGAVKSGANTWTGNLIDVGAGKVYSGTVTLQSDNALSLQGCIVSFLCQSETWTRVK
jgi:uncharacterized protein (DUF2147 family)